MNPKTILVLGGTGNTGRPLARLLLQETDVRLVLAGRNMAKANQLAGELNLTFEGNRVRCIYADAADSVSLKTAFMGVNFIVVVSSTSQFTLQIAKAALEAKACYLDIQYSSRKFALLTSMAEEIRQSGCCFITDGGFHPGLPALLIRYAARYFDRLQTARVGSVIKQDWKKLKVEEATIYELMELMNDFDMSIFKAGRWKKASLLGISDYMRMDFGAEFGRQYCAPMLLEEMRLLPEIYSTLQETGFYVGSFNWFTDLVIMPIALVAMKLWPQAALRPMSRWMHWGLITFSKPPYGTLLKVEAFGYLDEHPKEVNVTISHPDGYLFTAIPVAACLIQWLDGSISKPGLWLQAHIVEPVRFMNDMRRMGISVQEIGGGRDEMEPE